MYLGLGVTAYGTSVHSSLSEILTTAGYAYFSPSIIKTYGHDGMIMSPIG
jgi:hypothetical protein